MKTSQAGIDMIKQFEGCRLTAYKPVATEKYYTIGIGHYGPDVAPGMTISQARAEELLRLDLARFERAVNALPQSFNQNQFDALVSFAYNCGEGNLKMLCNNRTHAQIASAIPRYNKAGGKVLAGLTRRRNAERELFLKGATTKSIEDVAREVLDGQWGNGEQRKKNLAQAGYDYAQVQNEVNRLLRG